MTLNQLAPMDGRRQMVFLDRYALKRPDGRPLETNVGDMFHRVAGALGRDPSEQAWFNDAMCEFGFVPAGRCLTGAGGKNAATLYNCFVIGIRDMTGRHGRDSRVAIMNTMTRMVEINSRGGGVGINWSVLRPDGAYIRGVDGTSSGPNCWMRGADALADQIRQGGTRTAALMFMLNDWHPDAPAFAKIKERFRRANFSLAISDEFMDKVKHGKDWHTLFPRTTCPEYNTLWDGGISTWQYDVVECGFVPAREMWRDMSESAWHIGSPGVVFIDRCQKWSNTWYLSRVLGTNPCGEQPLPEDGCCNLGSMNLPAYWDEKSGCIDWETLDAHVRTAVSFLDRVIDVSPPIDPRISTEQARCRRIGLGTMGLADLFILMGIRYGTTRSLDEIDRIYARIRDVAYEWSAEMAGEQGAAPGFDERFLSGEFVKTISKEAREAIGQYGIRNLAILSQAPTGTTSTLAGVSSGIEPVFAGEYHRKDATGMHRVRHPLWDSDHAEFFVTASEISPIEHVRVQARVQKYIDSSVSKTVNMPANSTPEQIAGVYMAAYDFGCKGITVFREDPKNAVLTRCETCQI